jgi:hypothetical protein
MLASYLTALVVGGFFVALAAFGGADSDADAEVTLDSDAELGDASASIAEASHGVRKGKKKGFNPLASFRFWTFSSTFFGLTGAALTLFEASFEPLTLGLSAAMGISSGLTVSWLVQFLKSPVSSGAKSLQDYVGQVGPLLTNLRAGGTSKMRLRIEQNDLEFLVLSGDKKEIPKGTRVVILGFNEEGLARVAPDQALFLEEN